MYYPNTNQISALTGRTIKPDYESYIGEQVSALPQFLQLKENRDYNNAQLDLQERSLDESMRQNAMNYDLAKEQAESAKKSQLYGNLISGAGLGLNAYQALDESGVDLAGGASRALNAVLPSMESADSITDVARRAGGSFYQAPQMSLTDYATRGVNDWVVSPISGAADYVTDGVTDVAKKIGTGISDAWSDVSGWVEGLFS